MSETVKEIMDVSPDDCTVPKQNMLAPNGASLMLWRSQIDSINVERLGDGRRVLRCTQADRRIAFMLSPENASYLSALLGPGDVVLQGEPD